MFVSNKAPKVPKGVLEQQLSVSEEATETTAQFLELEVI